MRSLINKIIEPILRFFKVSQLVFNTIDSIKKNRAVSVVKKGIKEVKVDSTLIKSKFTAVVLCSDSSYHLSHFLTYYRNLGVDHFVFVLTNEDSESLNLLNSLDDCSIFQLDLGDELLPDQEANIFNYILDKYRLDSWTLVLKAHEFIIYPHIETRNLLELTVYLHNLEERALFATIIDCYSDYEEIIEEPIYNHFTTFPFYDKFNFIQKEENGIYKSIGGYQVRNEFKFEPRKTPYKNVICLLKIDKNTRFLIGRSLLNNDKYNCPIKKDLRFISGCLMAFDLKMMERNYSKETPIYNKTTSILFDDSLQLENQKFMQRGEWF